MSAGNGNSIVKLTTNIPFTLDVKYADIFSGRYGAQIRFKGTEPNGTPATLYVDAPSAIAEILAFDGFKREPSYNPDTIPEKGLQVELSRKRLTFLSEKPAGAKKDRLRIYVDGMRADQAAPRAPESPDPAPAPAAPTPVNPNTANREKRAALYRSITGYVLKHIVPIYTTNGIACNATDVAHMVDTIYQGEIRVA